MGTSPETQPRWVNFDSWAIEIIKSSLYPYTIKPETTSTSGSIETKTYRTT